MNTDERLKKLLDASPEQLEAIDGILQRRIPEKDAGTPRTSAHGHVGVREVVGCQPSDPVAHDQSGTAAESRSAAGSFRLRRADLEAIAARQSLSRGEAGPDSN